MIIGGLIINFKNIFSSNNFILILKMDRLLLKLELFYIIIIKHNNVPDVNYILKKMEDVIIWLAKDVRRNFVGFANNIGICTKKIYMMKYINSMVY